MTDDQPDQDGEAYWESARGFVRVLIAQLNGTLKSNRISAKKRREVCTNFVFGFCNFVDQQWFKPDGRIRYPLLCFSDALVDVDTQIDLSKIVFPEKSVELHAMVHDEIMWFFDEVNEDASLLPTGDFGAEVATVESEQADLDSVIKQPCSPCGGSGRCFCIRKGNGESAACPRCRGDGKCKHCGGSGYPGGCE